MKQTIIVRCKKCKNEWYVRESFINEFKKPISLMCPKCATRYNNIDYSELFVKKCNKFSMLQAVAQSSKTEGTNTTISPKVLYFFVIILILAILTYSMLQP